MHTKTEASESPISYLTAALRTPGVNALMISFLGPLEVGAARTNKKFKELIHDQKFWERLIKKHFPKYYESHIEILKDLLETKESKPSLDFKKTYSELYKEQNQEYYKMLWKPDDGSEREMFEPADSPDEGCHYESRWRHKLMLEFKETKITPGMDYRTTYFQKFKEKHAVYVRLLWLMKDFTSASTLTSKQIEHILIKNGFNFNLLDHSNWCDDLSLLSAIINTKNQNLLNFTYSCVKKFFKDDSGNINSYKVDNRGRSLFFWASILNQPESEMDALIKLNPMSIYKRISPEVFYAPNMRLTYTLSYLAKYGHKDLYIYLKKRGAPYRNATTADIHLASQYGHTDLVKHLAEQEPATIYSYSHSTPTSLNSEETPFEIAATHGQLEVLNLLLDIHQEILNPTPEEKNPKYKLNREKISEGKTFPNPLKRESGHTLFHSAAIEGHYKIIQRLQKESGIDVNSFFRLWNGEKQTPLNIALKHGPSGFERSPLFIRYLLNIPGNHLATIDINKILSSLAASDRFSDILKVFLQHQDHWWGVINAEGDNLLHIAAKYSAQNNLKLLLETNKINSGTRNAEQATPLEIAIDQRVISGFKVLFLDQLKQFSNEQKRKQFLYQPLYRKSHTIENIKFNFVGYAVAYNNVVLLKFLLPFYLPDEASPRQKIVFFNQTFDSQGRNLLHIAIHYRKIEMLEWLLHHHADINAVDPQGFPILFHSVVKYNKEVFDLLLSKGANLNFVTHNKKNLLHFLLESELSDTLIAGKLQAIIAAVLPLDISSFINQAQANGKTPLHLAIENNHLESATVLLETGLVNLKLRDQHGLTPLQLAINKQNWSMMRLIENQLGSVSKSFSSQPIDNKQKKMEEKAAKTDFFKAPKAVTGNTTPRTPTRSKTQEKRKHEETVQSETEIEPESHKKPKTDRPDRSYLLDPTL